MPDEVDIKVALTEHDGRITANAKAIERLEVEATLIGDLRVVIAELKIEMKTKMSQVQWLMGAILLSLAGIAFALMRKGLLL